MLAASTIRAQYPYDGSSTYLSNVAELLLVCRTQQLRGQPSSYSSPGERQIWHTHSHIFWQHLLCKHAHLYMLLQFKAITSYTSLECAWGMSQGSCMYKIQDVAYADAKIPQRMSPTNSNIQLHLIKSAIQDVSVSDSCSAGQRKEWRKGESNLELSAKFNRNPTNSLGDVMCVWTNMATFVCVNFTISWEKSHKDNAVFPEYTGYLQKQDSVRGFQRLNVWEYRYISS
jgi:hypothetical protein